MGYACGYVGWAYSVASLLISVLLFNPSPFQNGIVPTIRLVLSSAAALLQRAVYREYGRLRDPNHDLQFDAFRIRRIQPARGIGSVAEIFPPLYLSMVIGGGDSTDRYRRV